MRLHTKGFIRNITSTMENCMNNHGEHEFQAAM